MKSMLRDDTNWQLNLSLRVMMKRFVGAERANVDSLVPREYPSIRITAE